MRVITAAEMKKLDQKTIEEYGVPGVVLMENAGRQVVEVIRQVLGNNVRGKVVTVFVGKGNNGGDGFVIARHLFNMGAEVKVLALADVEDIKGDAAINLKAWQKMGQRIYSLHQGDSINIVRLVLMNTDLIVDAIYGTGFHGKMSDRAGRIVEVLNGSGKPIVSVDIPSGLEADTGKVHGPCIQAAHTVTFALPKLGLILEPGAVYTGELHVVDISIPPMLIEKEAPQRYIITAELVKEWLPPRPPAAHKGSFGRVLVVAGSRGMTGAAYLVGEAALRTGAGLITVAVPESLHNILETKLSEVMTVPLPDTGNGSLSQSARQSILNLLDNASVLALGPGISTLPEVVTLVRELLPSVRVPCVLDADALNALAGEVETMRKVQAPVIITPHPGEMARLLDISTKEIQEDRISVAEKAAVTWNVVTLLKGARTVVAAPSGAIYINPSGNPGMATGGSGDVLTGVIASLVAQGLEPVQAASAGAFIHGLAGDLGVRVKGMAGLTAGDIIHNLPAATREIVESE
ncbi:MAG: NAD(P)H-hydrate dehydratase [Desulfotomaculaceae bacterium]|nr:NAD(P)H-hydrate dehydratase [Desulfotomaculaceae bacterium]